MRQNIKAKSPVSILKDFLLTKSRFRIILTSGIGLYLLSWIIQKIFRVNASSKWIVNFTSRVIHGENLKLKNGADSVQLSLLTSGGCYINARDGVEIGEGTIFSFNVVIVSEGHSLDNLKPSRDFTPIKIGDKCWIGANSTILPGVVLGPKTIVGANSVVTSSFPDGHAVIAGTPAQEIKKLA